MYFFQFSALPYTWVTIGSQAKHLWCVISQVSSALQLLVLCFFLLHLVHLFDFLSNILVFCSALLGNTVGMVTPPVVRASLGIAVQQLGWVSIICMKTFHKKICTEFLKGFLFFFIYSNCFKYNRHRKEALPTSTPLTILLLKICLGTGILW